MASVGLGFGATLGASVLVFQHLRGQPGLVFLLPVYMYLFVVALGTAAMADHKDLGFRRIWAAWRSSELQSPGRDCVLQNP
jgi:uncharacterized membrane protein YdfJ with MMPL/SSD domain